MDDCTSSPAADAEFLGSATALGDAVRNEEFDPLLLPRRIVGVTAAMIAAAMAQPPAIHAALTVTDLRFARLVPEAGFWLIRHHPQAGTHLLPQIGD